MKKALATVGLAIALSLGATAASATPAAPVVQKAQAASYTSCFTAMNGERWCWRYGLTWFERYALGWTEGWVKTNTWYA